MYHTSVLLKESVDALSIAENDKIVDVTFGGGGHSRAILSKLGDEGQLFAFDQDEEAQKNLIEDDRFVFIDKNFRYMKRFLRLHGVLGVDGIFADLGVSSHQFDKQSRGFSIRYEAELDLRMDTRSTVTAKDVINTYPYERLREVLKLYGELNNAGRLASEICNEREKVTIDTTFDLKRVLEKYIPRNQENKFLAMVFQALRIEVNDELGALRELLQQSDELLNPGGRLVVISYHSLEDRLVKNYIKSGNLEGRIEKDFYGNVINSMKSVVKKPITPSEEELLINNRSRSAKMRVAEKIGG